MAISQISQTVFVAGATGAIGRPLVRLLIASGHTVFAMTRSQNKAEDLRRLGARVRVMDIYDTAAVKREIGDIRPMTVMHQLTDLPPGLNPALMGQARQRNARIRTEGTRILVDAAREAGALRIIAQSIDWIYAPGPRPHLEDDGLNEQGETEIGVVSLERAVLGGLPLTGIVLRYGHLYGPGTGFERASDANSVHADAAAQAALLALEKGRHGIYNICETNPDVSSEKAMQELGWDADFRLT